MHDHYPNDTLNPGSSEGGTFGSQYTYYAYVVN